MYFGFSPELNAAIDAGLAKYGPVELAKRFMFHYMRENGVTYGDVKCRWFFGRVFSFPLVEEFV